MSVCSWSVLLAAASCVRSRPYRVCSPLAPQENVNGWRGPPQHAARAVVPALWAVRGSCPLRPVPCR